MAVLSVDQRGTGKAGEPILVLPEPEAEEDSIPIAYYAVAALLLVVLGQGEEIVPEFTRRRARLRREVPEQLPPTEVH